MGPGVGKWECSLEKGFLGRVHSFFWGEGNGIAHFSNGVTLSLEVPILWAGYDGRVHCRDHLERVHSEEVKRWENLLEKDLGIIHFLREGNGRAHVKKGFPAPPV